MRQDFNLIFQRLASNILPPGLELYSFNGVTLHPKIKPEGGWDNSLTIFGLTIPTSAGRSLIVQVSPVLENLLLAEASEELSKQLESNLRKALALWSTRALPHEISLQNIIEL